MNTAVQLRKTSSLWCDLVYGAPREVVAGKLGRVAVFGGGQVVAYRIRSRRSTRLHILRTLDVTDRLAAAVPGVRPRVRLLVSLRTAGRARLAQKLFTYLLRTGRDPSALSDTFYVRVGAVLGGRLPATEVLTSLLSRSPAPQTPHARGTANSRTCCTNGQIHEPETNRAPTLQGSDKHGRR